MASLSSAARAVLDGPNLGHVVTVDPDGAPHVSCVWIGLDGDDIVFGTIGAWRKRRNLERDARVVLSVEGPSTNAMGLREYLVVHGTARVEEGGGAELLQRLADVYVGPGVRFPPMDDPPPGWVVRISIDRVSGVGDWLA